jgi:hypothetical protein
MKEHRTRQEAPMTEHTATITPRRGRPNILDSQGRGLVRPAWRVTPEMAERVKQTATDLGQAETRLVRDLLDAGLAGLEAMIPVPESGVPVPSTAVQAKAATYLLTGRVRVDHVDPNAGTFGAFVAGSSHKPYYVARIGGAWHCGCQATVTCAHVLACQMIAPPSPA